MIIQAPSESDLVQQSIERRLGLLETANADPELRAIVLAMCARDPVLWVNDWVWTVDPRRNPTQLPFDLFPKQADFLLWLEKQLEDKEDAIAEKSRDVGFTWLCIAFAVHHWLFRRGFKATFGSRKKALVDKLGDPDSIFEKARLLLSSLPWWMLPKRYADNELRLINYDNGATLTGEGGDNMGRGGRSTIYFIDEAAHIERAEKVDAAVSGNSDVKIKISTPNGPGNVYARQRFSGNFPVFTFEWLDDPRKNHWVLRDEAGSTIATGAGRDAPIGAVYPWYEKQKRTLDPVILAQEVDLDYNASLEGVCIQHEWVMAAVDLQHRIPDMIPRGRVYGGLDVAYNGKAHNVLITRQGAIALSVDDWKKGNPTQTAYKARDICRDRGVYQLNYDCVGPGSGVSGTLQSCDDVPFLLEAINGGDACLQVVWAEFGDRYSCDIFKNFRAEMYWHLRRRFEKTYEHVNGIRSYPLDELISIPSCPELIQQLGLPLVEYTDDGLIKLESKPSMAKRGVSSPDFADALAYAFAPRHQGVFAMSQGSWSY